MLRRDFSARASRWSSVGSYCPDNARCEEDTSAGWDREIPFPCTFHCCTCRSPRDRRAARDTDPPPPRNSRRCSYKDASRDSVAEERIGLRSPRSLPWDSGKEHRLDREEERDRGPRMPHSGFQGREREEKRDIREGAGRRSSRSHSLRWDRGSA